MTSDQTDDEVQKKQYVEDVLILVSIGLLFWLGVFERDETWAQFALGGVLLIMLIICIRRVRRTYRAFHDMDN